jgi:hypothetical protein
MEATPTQLTAKNTAHSRPRLGLVGCLAACYLFAATLPVTLPWFVGRYGVLLFFPSGGWTIVPASLLGLLATVTAVYQLRSRLLLMGGCAVAGLTLVTCLYDYGRFAEANSWLLFQEGRSDHVRAVFDSAMIADLKVYAEAQIKSADSHKLDLKPFAWRLRSGFWGLPRRASAFGQGDNLYIHLEWGSALISHHGLAISSKVLDPNPFPTEENSVSYYPLCDGAYLFHDIH